MPKHRRCGIKCDRIFARRSQTDAHEFRIVPGTKVTHGRRVGGNRSDKHCVCADVCDFDYLGHGISDLFEVDKVLGTISRGQLPALGSCVYYNDPGTQVVGKLNTLHPDTTATTHKDSPLTHAEP